MAGLVAHLALPRAHLFNDLANAGIMVDPLLFDRLELVLIGFEQGLDRRHRLSELLASLLEEGLAGIAEQLARDLVELRRQALLGVLQRLNLLSKALLALLLRGLE